MSALPTLALLALQAAILGAIAVQIRSLKRMQADLQDMLLLGVMLPPASPQDAAA